MVGRRWPTSPVLLGRNAYIGTIETAQNVADRSQLSRDEIDAFAPRSQQHAAVARDSDRLAKEIVPLTIPATRKAPGRTVSHDEFIRDDTTLELLAALSAEHGIDPRADRRMEIHEAVSAQALGVLRELPNQLDGYHVPDDELTPNGGAVAIAHPFGATGVRYALTLATELRQRHLRYGAIGVCICSRQGVISVELWALGAGALELPDVRVGGEGY